MIRFGCLVTCCNADQSGHLYGHHDDYTLQQRRGDICTGTTANIFLSMIVAHYNDAEMMKMHGAGNGAGDVCAGDWLGHHAGQHGGTLHPGGFVRDEFYYYKHDGNRLG